MVYHVDVFQDGRLQTKAHLGRELGIDPELDGCSIINTKIVEWGLFSGVQ